VTGRNLPKIRQQREPDPSIINEKTFADFTRVVEQTGFPCSSRQALWAAGLESVIDPHTPSLRKPY
jgi:hypothetical protein